MAKYRITGPDGATYEVNAPDGASEADVMAYVQRNAKMQPKAAVAAPDPTEGMSGMDKFLAGAGKAFHDIGQGVGQMVGLTSRKDVEETRRRDAALMNTGAGLAGNIVGNVAALLPTALIPGAATIPGAALIGAASGLVQPSTSTGETLTNVGIGGAVGPAAILAGRGAAAVYQGGKALVEPLTKSGQERIAASVLQASATDPVKAAANAARAKALVPGSQPTLAQVADDPGLAQLERTLLNNPEYAPALQQRFANQRAARLGAVKEIGGTDDYYDAIKEGRRIFANEDYAAALKQGVDPQMAQAIQPQLESLMRRPSIKEAQKVAQRIAAEKDVSLTEFGSLEGLDWVKKALDKQINAIKTGNPIGNTDLETLLTTKADLMATLEQLAPGYKAANDNFAAMSRQINSMDVARNLNKTLQRPGSEYAGNSAKEMGQRFSEELSKSKESVKKATGMNKGISDVMNTRDIAALEAVAKDYGRKSFAENAGRATGSNTMQNMASQNMLRRMLGPAGLPDSWAESTMLQAMLSPVQAGSKLLGADKRIMDRIALGLLDPTDAAVLLTAPPPVTRGLLGSPVQRALPGVTSGGLLGVQLPQ
jgi:hypothetical protein